MPVLVLCLNRCAMNDRREGGVQVGRAEPLHTRTERGEKKAEVTETGTPSLRGPFGHHQAGWEKLCFWPWQTDRGSTLVLLSSDTRCIQGKRRGEEMGGKECS